MVVARALNPRTLETETGGVLGVQGQTGLQEVVELTLLAEASINWPSGCESGHLPLFCNVIIKARE